MRKVSNYDNIVGLKLISLSFQVKFCPYMLYYMLSYMLKKNNNKKFVCIMKSRN